MNLIIIENIKIIGINRKSYNTNNRVNPGGNYNNTGANNPASNRNNNNPSNNNDNIGFRLTLIQF